MNEQRTCAQPIDDRLRANGVDRVFTVPGESFLPVLDALNDAPDLQLVVCRQEGGATMMAEAHAKLTGRPGVCFVTRGPGSANALAGLHVAAQDSTPLLMWCASGVKARCGKRSASVAIRNCDVYMDTGSCAPAMFPSCGSVDWSPLPSTGSCRAGSPPSSVL